MQPFHYKAYSADGNHHKGLIEARDEIDANQKLLGSGLRPYAVQASKSTGSTFLKRLRDSESRQKLSSKELTKLFDSLFILLDSGFTLDESLLLVQQIESNTKLVGVFSKIRSSTSQGADFADALEKIVELHPSTCAIIGAGEASGNLASAIGNIARQQGERSHFQNEILSAVTYPIFLVCLLLIVLVLLSLNLVPALVPIFESSDTELPLLMNLLLGFGEMISSYGTIISTVLLCACIVCINGTARTWLKSNLFFILKQLPLLGPLLQRATAARYLTTLGALTESNVNLIESLSLSASVHGQSEESKLRDVARFVSEGKKLHTALAESGIFDGYIISMISIGEESNSLGKMATRAAVLLENRVKETTHRVLGALSPALTIVLGLLVGGLVLSVMTALLELNEVAIR